MNVNDAMETAAAYFAANKHEKELLFFSESVAITLANEVGRLRAELAETKAENVGLAESHYRIEAELAAAKAAESDLKNAIEDIIGETAFEGLPERKQENLLRLLKFVKPEGEQ